MEMKKEKVSIFQQIKVYKQFKKIIRDNRDILSKEFNIRVDRTYRLYTVINVPEILIGEAYSLKKSDIDKIAENFNRDYTLKLSEFLDSKGAMELYKVYEIKKVDKYSYLIVVGFSLFQSNKYYSNLYYKLLPISLVFLLSLLFFILI